MKLKDAISVCRVQSTCSVKKEARAIRRQSTAYLSCFRMHVPVYGHDAD